MAAPAAATAPPLGVILQAQRANVGNGAAASGSTMFDGDLLQTDRDGLLRVRFGSSQAYLMPGGAAVVHQSADGFAANLTRGESGSVLGPGPEISFGCGWGDDSAEYFQAHSGASHLGEPQRADRDEPQGCAPGFHGLRKSRPLPKARRTEC